MLKTLGLLIAGLCVGLVVSTFALRNPDLHSRASYASFSTDIASSADERLAALRSEIEQRFEALDGRLTGLADEIAALRAASPAPERASAPIALSRHPDESSARIDEMAERIEEMRRLMAESSATANASFAQRDTEQLLAAGFSPERIAWLSRRSDELRMEVLQSHYEARQRGELPGPDATLTHLVVESKLRAEIGDAEFERYLNALGKPTTVGIRKLLDNSPAAEAGLQVGDAIVRYDGKRVFNRSELTKLIYDEGVPSEPIVVDVTRDGQAMQVILPRGPLGISGDVVEDILRISR